jgi:hypothetical protein
MSKTNVFENELLEHIFNNADITLIGDAAGLLGSAADGSLHISLHTSDPGEAGDQTTNEATYGSYARVAVARDGSGWTVSANSVSPDADIEFPEATSGSETITHFGVGASASAAGKLLYKGTVSPNIAVTTGVIPRLTTATAVTED